MISAQFSNQIILKRYMLRGFTCYNMSLPNVCSVDFDIDEMFLDIPDSEILTATQMIESNVGCSLQCYNPVFSDISI